MSLPINFKHVQISLPRIQSVSPGLVASSNKSVSESPQLVHIASSPTQNASPLKTPDGKALKPPKPPEKPLMPYMRYTREVWDSVKVKHPDMKLWEIGKIIGQMWRQISEEAKNKYIKDYESSKIEYDKSMKEYHSSPPYLAYLAAKTKLESAAKPVESNQTSATVEAPTVLPSKPPAKLFIEPAEDPEDLDEEYSMKHVAYARYRKSHRLMNCIFSDSVVPVRTDMSSASRLEVIDRQMESLTKYQQKLEKELNASEEKFQAKKRKSEEQMEAFENEMTKLQKQYPISDEQFQQMVNRHLVALRKERAAAAAAGTSHLPESTGGPSGAHGARHSTGGSIIVSRPLMQPHTQVLASGVVPSQPQAASGQVAPSAALVRAPIVVPSSSNLPAQIQPQLVAGTPFLIIHPHSKILESRPR